MQGLQCGAEGVGPHELAGCLRQPGLRQVGLHLLQCLRRPSPHAALSAQLRSQCHLRRALEKVTSG